ncbi:MAG: BACON domain-containing protein [Tannerellaceae bacterium]|jgi:hypothetical protein|nr:BACON domain-containing protein [Tannerellaceae bacterium]
MKKILFALIAALVLLSCGKDDDPSVDATLSVEPVALSFTAQATETHDVVVMTNQSSWDAVSSQSWCTITKGSDKFTVKAAANTSTSPPAPAIITVTADKARPVTINVTQSGVGAELSVSPDAPLTFSSTGGANEAKTITVTTNQSSWNVTSNQYWCTVTKSGNKFTATASANTAEEKRKAVITVSSGSAANVSIDVTQTGAYTEDTNLEAAIYTLGYAANAADQFNKGLKPSNIYLPGTTNYVALSLYYLPNGALDHGTSYIPGGEGSTYGWVYYGIDMGRRPFIMTSTTSIDSRELSFAARSAVRAGTYDYATDPVYVIAYFGDWTGSSVFTSLDNLKLITNNSAITERIYNSMSFTNNCYKMIVFGKNTSGKLIGKYAGYSASGKTYVYWCLDPESPAFGQQESRNTPYY